MIKMNLQLFAATAVHGKRLVYFFRILKDATTKSGRVMAFTTENTRSKSKDFESTETKDGPVPTPGATEGEVSVTALLSVAEDSEYATLDEMEDAMDASDTVEIWEVNLDKPASGGTNKFSCRYFHSNITELEISSSAEEMAEVELTFALVGNGKTGEATVTKEQQEAAEYQFKDLAAAGA